MDTIQVNSFFDELTKIGGSAGRELRLARALTKKLRSGVLPSPEFMEAAGRATRRAQHRLERVKYKEALEKVGEDDRKITKERFQRFLRAGAVGAAGAGLGYGTGRLIGRPLEEKLVRWGMKAGPAKALRYLVPTLGGLGAASMLARSKGTTELFRKIQGDDRNIHSSK